MKTTFSLLALALLAVSGLQADNTITSGTFTVGIGPNGELFDYNSYIGFRRLSDGYDPLAPGNPRDSWGVSDSSGSAWADQAYYGSSGVSSTYTTTPGTASYTTTTTNMLTVVQNFGFLAPNILGITTTVTNNGPASDVVFQRDIDWDVYPTEFHENSFGNPISGNVIDSSYYGFESPDPAAPYYSSCAAGCNWTSDLGGGIKIDLGMLLTGGSDTFRYLYGISQLGENVNGLIGQAEGFGAYYYIATQSSENGAYPNLGTNSAIIGVANATTVPEPSSWALFLTVAGGIGFGFRRRLRAL
jgi:hypothetical protein